jgi:hypothetical protein
MNPSHRQGLFLLWLLLSGLLAAYLHSATDERIRSVVKQELQRHFTLTLDEAYFSSSENNVNEAFALQRIGQNINAEIDSFLESRVYASRKSCRVQLLNIDELALAKGDYQLLVGLSIPRNQIEREINLGVDCTPDWWPAIGIAGLLGVSFILIGAFLPPPLSRSHRYWINYMAAQGYSGEESFEVLGSLDADKLDLNAVQTHCLEELHDPAERNFARAIRIALDSRVARLSGQDADWLLLSLQKNPGDLDAALALANTADEVTIDLTEMRLAVRGLDIEMSGTPLFYYAWYALARVEGDGWIVNPPSNRPDIDAGGKFASLMERCGGHARAINDLQQAGLKAKTLDQNRSKIKDELCGALGENLATNYLFEADRHNDGVNTRYRITLVADQISIIY